MTDTPGWTPPTEPGGSDAGPPAPQGAPPGFGAPPPPPPGYGGQPGYGQQPGWGQPGYGGGYGGQPGYGGGYGGQPGYGQPGYAGWGAPGWGRAAAPEPGIVPLRPLGLGEILDGAFAVVRKYPRVTLGLSAIVVSITQLIGFAFQAWTALDDGYVDPDAFGGFTLGRAIGFVVSGIGIVVLAGMLTTVMGEAVLGRGITIGETWAKVRPRFWPLLGASIVGSVVPALGLLLCIAPGAFLWGAWAFLTPIVVLERSGVIASIRRSWRLAVPDFWRVFGIRLLSTIIAGFISSVITIPLTLAALGGAALSGAGTEVGILPAAIVTLAAIIAGTITAPFSSGVVALLYIDRRMRAEALDVTLAQAAAQQAGPA